MRRTTLRLRLTIVYGGLFLLAGCVLLAVTYLLVRQTLYDRTPEKLSVVSKISVEQAGKGGTETIVQLSDGRKMTAGQAAIVLAQEQEQFRRDTLESVWTRGGIALGASAVVAFGFGWLLAERALRPVHDITATARRVAAAASAHRGLGERIALSGPRDEIKELAETFDDMLERLDRSFDSQRRFVANASHELRTPLALNRALVEVATTRPGASADLCQLGEALLAINARHERLIDGLLTLADSETEVTERSRVDLRDIARHVLDQAVQAGEAVRAGEAVPAGERVDGGEGADAGEAPGAIEVRESELAPAPTGGDPVLLERIVQNLVENAIRHNLAGGWLSVRTGLDDGRASLTVTNTGPVLAPYEMEMIFEPFRRLGGDRVRSGRGFGLGLSIVRAATRAHGGEVSAVPRAGGGLVVTVSLPPYRTGEVPTPPAGR